MLTLLVGALIGLAAGSALTLLTPLSVIWGVVLGVLGFIATGIIINLVLKKRLEAVFTGVQGLVEGQQADLRRKINLMQTKMTSGGKGLQRRMEKEQAAGIRQALKHLEQAEPLFKWNILARRQTNTLRAQLHYQIKEFDQADAYFEKCFIMDPLTYTMRMARVYAHAEPERLEKMFRKGLRRFKDEHATLLYALYSWILVKEKRIDEAVALLNEGKGKTEDETIRANWEHLANGRLRQFSNAGIGEQWYALHLETPKPIKVRQRFGSGKRLR